MIATKTALRNWGSLLFLLLLSLVFCFCFPVPSFAINKVGNGDEGDDLEGATKITAGPILTAQKSALQLLVKVNTAGVPGLGMLQAEIAEGNFFAAQKNVQAVLPEDQGSFHSNLGGFVYARTFATPHAATRFFPVTSTLSRDQLVALHIHEALHRSLNEKIRENEQAVSALTLAITAPDATFDQLREISQKWIPEDKLKVSYEASAPEEFPKPASNVGYIYREFLKPNRPMTYPVSRMHVLHSDLYPFGWKRFPVGFGLEMSWLQGNGVSNAGPLGASVRGRVINKRGFDFSVWGSASLVTLSAEELKNSAFGRDVFTLGVSMRKDLAAVYVENYISYNFQGESTQSLGGVTYKYHYGSVFDVKIRTGVKAWKFDLGVFGEMHLAESFKVSGGAFKSDFGRYRLLSVGPELIFTNESFSIGVLGRYLADATRGANFDFLGNLMGAGLAQGSLAATLRVFF